MSDDPTPAAGAPGNPYQQPWQGDTAPGWQQQGDPYPGAYPPGPPAPDYWSGQPGAYGGGQMPPGYIPPYPGPMAPATSGWAIASLILAICGWTVLPFLGAIGGVVTGHIALHEIANSQGRIEGRGFAIAGLIIGYAAIAALVALIALIVVVALLLGTR